MRKLRNHDRLYTPEEERAVVSGYRNGLTAKQIANILRRSHRSIIVKAATLRSRGQMVPRSAGAPLGTDAGPVPQLTDFRSPIRIAALSQRRG